MRLLCAVVVFAGLAAPAAAGPILDRIKAAGVLRCGGVERPGLVEIAPNGQAHGLELDLCRALASVVLGADGRLEFTRYDSDKAFAAARAGHDDVMFLTGREMVENGLADQVIPGSAIFIETTKVMTPDDKPYHHLSELAGKPICFALGPHAQFHLHAWFARRQLDFTPMAFQEDVEMNDAYKVGYCQGVAGEATTLADTARAPEMAGKPQRLLPETLAAYPILVATSTRDGEWAAIVAWSLATLQRADAPDSQWMRGGYQSLPIAAPALGLAKDWQQKLVALVGGYAELYDKNLGAKSGLKLAPETNAASMPPFVD